MPQAGRARSGPGRDRRPHDRVDQRARGEVLSCARFDVLRVARKQTLVDLALHVDRQAQPGLRVDHPDEPLELGRVLDFVLRLQKDRADDAGLARQRLQQLAVFRRERLAREFLDVFPARTGGDERRLADQLRPLLVHLEEQEIGNLRDIGLIGDALIAQHMREIPDLCDESFGVHVGSSSRAGRPRRRGEASGVASRASSALAGSSAGSCGTRRPSKEAFKIDCLRRAASPVSASSSFSASSAAANASETRRRISNASEVGGSGTGSRLNLDMLIEARFVVCLPCSMKKRRPISFA